MLEVHHNIKRAKAAGSPCHYCIFLQKTVETCVLQSMSTKNFILFRVAEICKSKGQSVHQVYGCHVPDTKLYGQFVDGKAAKIV